jgi:ABC-2 type transport system ATP-binding protein
MRVHEYLDFFGAAFGIARRKRKLRIDEVMEICGATYMRDRYVESLSHGMQQRIGIARTLLHDPQVLIFDEPANGLDPEARIEMRELLLRLAEMGKTLIVTSHILPELARICDQVAILTQGQLRAFGSLEQIMSNLNQQRMVEVQLATTSMLEQAVQLIRGSIESDAEITSSEAEAIVRFRSAQKEADLGQLLAKLVTAGINVTQFREVQSDLEEAFLTVTREHSAAQQTEAMSNRPAESAKETQ